VIHSPGHAGAARRYRDNLDNLIHLKPAEDDVLLARRRSESKKGTLQLHLTKESKEKEDVAGSDLLVLEVRLRCIALAENRPPAGAPGQTSREDIRIDMRAVFATYASSRQLLDEVADRFPGPAKLLVGNSI
jgi:hypothetical protein